MEQFFPVFLNASSMTPFFPFFSFSLSFFPSGKIPLSPLRACWIFSLSFFLFFFFP